MNLNYQQLTDQQKKEYDHVLNFSGGRTSGYLLIHELEKKLDRKYFINFANTGKESEETLEFVNNCDKYIQEKYGHKIRWVELDYESELKFKEVTFETASRKGEPFLALISKYGYLPNMMNRFCTGHMKIQTMENFRKANGLDKKKYIVHIGIRYDEPKRWGKVTQSDDYGIIYHPLVEDRVTVTDVKSFWKTMPFDLMCEEPFGNCDLCFLKSPRKRVAVLKARPEAGDFWEAAEKLTGKKFDLKFSVPYLKRLALGTQALTKDREGSIDRPDIDCTCNVD